MDVDETEETEGLSTPQKVAAGAALGVAIPAAVAVAKKLMGDNDDGSEETHDADEPTQREAREAAPKPKARRTQNRTREQLYKQATRLKIEGRSSMTKAELERAVERAKKKVGSR